MVINHVKCRKCSVYLFLKLIFATQKSSMFCQLNEIVKIKTQKKGGGQILVETCYCSGLLRRDGCKIYLRAELNLLSVL